MKRNFDHVIVYFLFSDFETEFFKDSYVCVCVCVYACACVCVDDVRKYRSDADVGQTSPSSVGNFSSS